ncbi:unnamed protein product [Mytilus coruscus]|uniref:Uncharacterized protein n=1 Tax=Mytilus coruscus TaxID=42192 RepID=A0A6J8A4G9_MYTCO|nr:unnamed protein product [Mytilus coruscus]
MSLTVANHHLGMTSFSLLHSHRHGSCDFGAYSNTNIVITVNLVSNMSFNDISDDETLDETPLADIQRSRVRQRAARNLRDLIQDSEHEDCQSEDDGSTDEFLAASPDILHQNSSTSRQISQTPVRNRMNTPSTSSINTPSTSSMNTPRKSGVGSTASSGPCRESSTPNARSMNTMNTSSNDIHSLGQRDLLIRIYERQEEILQRLKAQTAHAYDNSSAKSKENLVVPIGVKNAVKQGYKDGEEKGLCWSFEGKRVSDAVNKDMTSHIVTFVKGWNPAYNDITVLNCAMARYFLTKKQQQSAISKNKYEGEKRKRALYERKKEKAKRRLIALEKHDISAIKKAKITEALKPVYMSSDEEGQEGFITHQPSWQSPKFKEYKAKLDGAYLDICSTKSRRLLQSRVIGDMNNKETPDVGDNLTWIIK